MPEGFGTFFHVGYVVEDIERAAAELGVALGLHFNEPHESRYGEWTILVCYASDGPPFVELVQGEPGSPWDTSRGSRADHIGYFAPDLARDKRALERAGLPIDIDGTEYGGKFTYHRAPHAGMRLELIDEARRAPLLERLTRRSD